MTITQKHVGCSEVPANTSPRVCRALFCSGPFLTLSFGNLDLRHDMGLVGREELSWEDCSCQPVLPLH